MQRSGLVNLGNTCYMNSLMQILVDIEDFNTIFKLNKKKNNLFYIFESFYNDIKKSKGVFNPSVFLKNLQISAKNNKRLEFIGYDQNDPSELLIYLLDQFHNDIKRSVDMNIKGISKNNTDDLAIKCYKMKKQTLEKEYSELYDLFYFIEINQVFNNNNLENIPQWNCQLSLPLPDKYKEKNGISLYNCIEDYSKITNINNNKHIQSRFWNFPNVLVIVLQRFSSTFNKNNILVTFPLENLDISKYVIGYNSNKYVYDLIGVCNHSGNIMGGHYTCYSKNKNKQWVHYNDTNASLVKNLDSIISNNAYCLFYKKNII